MMITPFEIILVLVAVAFIVATILKILYEYKKREIISTVTPLSRGESSERELIYRLIRGGVFLLQQSFMTYISLIKVDMRK